jgi:tetratricopeptide (TPR) repeat protein
MHAGGSSPTLFFTQFQRLFQHLRTLCLAAVLLASASALPAAAQPVEADSMQVRRFQLADSYLRAGQTDRAITLLEDLYAENPDTYAFYSKLKEAYESVKRYDDAVALVDERLAQDRTAVRLSEKARLTYLSGDEEAAFATWDEALATAPDQATTYRIVYQALVDARRFERAIDVLEQGRTQLGQSDEFRIQIAYLYSLTGQHTAAINEYLALLSDNERRLGFVRSRLSTFIQQDDALSASIEGVETAVRTNPMNLAYRELLAWLHMEAEDYRAAFDVYRAIDRLQQESGRRLLGFARQAADAEAYGVALDAYDELLSRYPDAPVTPEARHSLGDMHRRWAETTGERVFDDRGNRITAPHYEAAVDAYRTYLQEYPDREAYPVVLRKLGRLQQDVFLRLNEAESALREVVNRYPESEAADEARYDLGRLALMRNNLDDARLTFSRLVERLRTGDLAEQARYELALLQFYEGSFETAMARIRSTNTNTSTDVANDAIELKVLILQNKGPDSLNTPLRHFAEARLEHRQRRFNQALATLDTLLTVYGQHALNDEARFLRASVLRDQGRADSAEVAFAELSMLFPQSPLADRSLFEAARLQEEALGDPASALKTYTKILEQYPSSLLAARARERIRALQANTSS